MLLELQLIQLYLWVCHLYDTCPALKFQRWGNHHEPAFTDQELVTVYLLGQMQGLHRQTQIHAYVAQHWREWFPLLPSYQAFNRRLNDFCEVWETLFSHLMPPLVKDEPGDQVLDSLPVMLAVRSRSHRARVAHEYADVGYCATKQMYYHGLKIHLLAQRQPGTMPRPQWLAVTPASRHDLPVLQANFQAAVAPGVLFGDLAYQDAATQETLAQEQVTLCTRDKKQPGQKHYAVGQSGLWSRFVSSMRQPIESIFNWLIEKTDIQNAARVRSANGLLVHCYGKLTATFYQLQFNP